MLLRRETPHSDAEITESINWLFLYFVAFDNGVLKCSSNSSNNLILSKNFKIGANPENTVKRRLVKK